MFLSRFYFIDLYSKKQKNILKNRIYVVFLQSKRMTYENYNRKEIDGLCR